MQFQTFRRRGGRAPKAGMGMARALARRVHEVAVYTTNFNGTNNLDVPPGVPLESGGVTVKYFPVHAPRFWETCLPLDRALRVDAGKEIGPPVCAA